jgi:hypothetical protein
MAQLSMMRALRSGLIMFNRLESHCARLLAMPHCQSHREIFSTRHITAGQIRDGPGQLVHSY